MLAEGKTVLFVADKMAALSVVQNRLKQLGLDPFSLELHSNKTNKRDVFAQFEAATNLQKRESHVDWQQELEKLTRVKRELDSYVKALHQERSLGMSIYEMIERYSHLAEEANTIVLDEAQVMEAGKETFHEYLESIKQLAIAGGNLPDLTNSPWTHIDSQTFSFKLRDDVLTVSQHIIDHYGETKRLLEQVVDQLGIQSERQPKAWFTASKQLLSLLDQRPNGKVHLLSIHDFDVAVQQIKRLIEIGKERDRYSKELEKIFESTVLELNVRELLRDIRVINSSWFVKKHFGRRNIAKQLAGYVKSGQSLKKEELEQEIERMQTIIDLQAKLDEEKDLMETYFGRFWDKGNWVDLQHSIEWMSKARYYLEQIAATGNSDFKTMTERFVEAIAEQNKPLPIEEVITALEQMMKAEEELQALLSTDRVDENEPFWLSNLYERAMNYVNYIDSLKEGCHFASVKQVVLRHQLGKVLIACVNGEVPANKLLESFECSFLRLRIDGEIRNDRTLSAFHSVAWKEKITSFKQLDTLLTEVTKEEIYARMAAKVPEFREDNIKSSEPGILQRAIRSNGRGISIRQLFKKIPNLLKRLKPCMLMSPISVAQYLDPEHPLFDVVIFDEASQLPTCEAIGAMARGKHVVVVGDPKQLPPTSFFQSGQEEEEDFYMQDLESLLDDCLALDMPQKHLRWHYRSEHESLISFSNHHYYKDELVTFPSIDSSTSRVSFRKINGIYEKGKGRHNVQEAEAVVDEVMARLREHSAESIGVVTFNQAQQTLIEDLIEERLKEEPELESYFNQETPEPVFVKNLENVQGDERDIILFSVGYGPDQNGKVSMNFGPLNREGGWRRLNVAVSRAKREMVVFSSMEPEQIDLSRTKAEGVIGLRAFMMYAKNGRLPATSSHSKAIGSLIEQVAKSLTKAGLEVDTHVGDSSYKVDVAIRHPNRFDTYIAAVQLDSINYANAQTTRDREKLRESMLERLGWKIIKVSSLDWWHDPEKETRRIVKEVTQAPEKISREPERDAHEIIRLEHSQAPRIAGQSSVYSPEKTYEIADLEYVELPGEYFYHIESSKIIREQIEQIIVKEAPISLPQLTRKIAHAWGFSRSGRKIEDVVLQNVRAEQLPTSKSGDIRFVWRDDEQRYTYQSYRPGKVESRQINDICHQEAGNAMTALMRQSLSLPKDDLIRETAKLFGFTRLGTNVMARLELTLDYLKETGVLEETKDRFIQLK